MTFDPAFGLLFSVPLLIAAVAALAVTRPSRRAGAIIAAGGVLAFVVGCGNHVEQSASNVQSHASTAASTAAPAVRARPSSFTGADVAAATRAKQSGTVSVDVLDTRPNGARNQAITVAAAQTVYVIGWAYSETGAGLCDGVGLLVDGKRIIPALYGYPRPDVAAFYKEPSRTNVGYSISVPAQRLGRGAHQATVVCVRKGSAPTRLAEMLDVTVQ